VHIRCTVVQIKKKHIYTHKYTVSLIHCFKFNMCCWICISMCICNQIS